MAPLPLAVIAAEFGAALAFGAILDLVKIPVLLASYFLNNVHRSSSIVEGIMHEDRFLHTNQ
jgi:hypothetical protein